MQVIRSKVGSRKKGRRSSKKKPYYQAYRLKYPSKLIRRRADRERRLAAAKEHPEIGSPSQLRWRRNNKPDPLIIETERKAAFDQIVVP
jgi:hypothetical protein